MIKDFEKSFLGRVFNYNDPAVELNAENLFEKIRQKFLAGYVIRNKEHRVHINVNDNSKVAPIFAKDHSFTFGYAYCGEHLDVDNHQIISLGKIYKIEFEFLLDQEVINPDFSLLSDNLWITGDCNLIIHGKIFENISLKDKEMSKVRIERVNDKVRVFIDDVECQEGEQILDSDDDTNFNTLYLLSSYGN